jgi:hypothetical protein
LDNGEFVILGSIIFGDHFTDPDYNHDIWLIKTDSNGEMIWDSTYDRDDQDAASTIHELDDGGFIIAGDTGSMDIPRYSDILLLKTNSDGELVWDKTFSKNDHEYADSIQISSDGGFIILGNTYEPDPLWYNIWIIKTNSDGEKIWDVTFGDNGYDWGNSMQTTSDGGFVIGGYYVGFFGANPFLLKANGNGEKEWIRYYDKMGNGIINAVKQTSDSGYILAGNFNTVSLGTDAWLIKTDSEGNVARNRLIVNSFLMRFFERFPNAFPILRSLIGL